MSIQTEIVKMHELMLSKGASQAQAHAIAQALYHELVPGCDSCTARDAVTKALTKVAPLAETPHVPGVEEGPADGDRRLDAVAR